MRVEGWESRLTAHLETAGPFRWGQNDCALWSADWVFTATGRDFASDWRGLYETEAELGELLLARGISDPAELPTRVGLEPVPVPFARRGDVVLWRGCLGVCAGLTSFFLTEHGVTPVRTRSCERAWRVG